MIAAQMIARNEENRYLRPVLARLRQQVDLIVFTDDCSTDNTPEIAQSYGAKVYQSTEPLFMKDESALRSMAWHNLSQHVDQNWFILAIDADEMLYASYLERWVDQPNWDVLGITFYHLWAPGYYRADKAWAPTVSSRLFRYYSGGEFMKRQLACGSEPNYVRELIRRGRFNPNTGFRMLHYGYLKDEDKVAKYKRYTEIDAGKFHSFAHIESILDKKPTLMSWVES